MTTRPPARRKSDLVSRGDVEEIVQATNDATVRVVAGELEARDAKIAALETATKAMLGDLADHLTREIDAVRRAMDDRTLRARLVRALTWLRRRHA